MAEKGIFNKQGLTPIESVYSANLYSVMYYIALETAEDTYKAELQDQANDEAKRKSKRK